jgi:hypothetical protein
MRDTLVGEVWAAMDCRTNRKVVVKVYFRHLVSRGRAGGRAGGRGARLLRARGARRASQRCAPRERVASLSAEQRDATPRGAAGGEARYA